MSGVQQKNHQPLVKKLVLAVIGMFAFAFALVPLYDVFCDITGLNGKPDLSGAPTSEQVDSSRLVAVDFISHIQNRAPVSVRAEQQKIEVKPGQMHTIAFEAINLANTDKVIQAVPSVSPGIAAKYMHKVECFCFNQQALKAGEKVKLPLLFYLDTELPEEIQEVTLSYTVFDISQQLNTEELSLLFSRRENES